MPAVSEDDQWFGFWLAVLRFTILRFTSLCKAWTELKKGSQCI